MINRTSITFCRINRSLGNNTFSSSSRGRISPPALFFSCHNSDGQQRKRPPTKLRFKPKAPPPRQITRRSATPSQSGGEAALINQHLRRLAQKHDPKEAKLEKPSITVSEQVSSGNGSTSTDTIRTSGAPTTDTSDRNSGSRKKGGISEGKQEPITMPFTDEADDTFFSSTDEEEEYKEPYDYNSIYPVTLPLRPPFSGDPELLDMAEFGNHSINMGPIIDEDYKDPITNPALEFGLQEDCEGQKMFLVQLPTTMPFVRRASVKGKEKEVSETPKEGCKLESLPAGVMGKMLVYKSGAVKFKVGEGDNATFFDVDSGVDNSMPVQAVAVNTDKKHFCVLGDIEEHKMIFKLNIDE